MQQTDTGLARTTVRQYTSDGGRRRMTVVRPLWSGGTMTDFCPNMNGPYTLKSGPSPMILLFYFNPHKPYISSTRPRVLRKLQSPRETLHPDIFFSFVFLPLKYLVIIALFHSSFQEHCIIALFHDSFAGKLPLVTASGVEDMKVDPCVSRISCTNNVC